MIAVWILVVIAIILFIDGFMEPAKVESHNKNKAMTSLLYLTAKALYVPNRFGAWLRRMLAGIRRA